MGETKIKTSVPYTAENFDDVNTTFFNKFHNIKYTASKVEIRDGEIFFTIEGKEYNAEELYKNFDERYRSFDLGGEYYYLPAGMREESIFTKQIEEKERELKKVCPICGSKNVTSSEEPRDLRLDFNSNDPTGLYIKCNDCGFTLHEGKRINNDEEKLEIFGSFVDRWNSFKIEK